MEELEGLVCVLGGGGSWGGAEIGAFSVCALALFEPVVVFLCSRAELSANEWLLWLRPSMLAAFCFCIAVIMN